MLSGRYIPVAETKPNEATASLVIVLVSRIQVIGPRENNFVKWKETFRRYVQKCTHWRKWQKWQLIAKIAKL